MEVLAHGPERASRRGLRRIMLAAAPRQTVGTQAIQALTVRGLATVGPVRITPAEAYRATKSTVDIRWVSDRMGPLSRFVPTQKRLLWSVAAGAYGLGDHVVVGRLDGP
jgi:hypothetical protein